MSGRWRLLAVGLAVAVIAGLFNLRLLRSFEFLEGPKFVAPYYDSMERTPPAPGAPTPARATDGVLFVLIDGLRVDASRKWMPALDALRERGADLEAWCHFPTFTRPGVATLMTGAPPRVHGVLANAYRRPLVVEHLFGVAAGAGVHTRFVKCGETGLTDLFEGSIRRTEEWGGTEVREVGKDPTPWFTFVYIEWPDLEAHDHGGLSDAYRMACEAADSQLVRLLAQVDLERVTVCVTTDHGHIDRGGHGGHEEVCRRIPLVLAGKGVPRGVRGGLGHAVLQEDVAPTLARLLGLAAPAHATGRALFGELASASVAPAAPHRNPRPGGEGATAAGLGGKEAFGLAVGLAAIALVAFALHPLLRRASARTWLGAVLAVGAFWAAYTLFRHPYSFSLMNDPSEIPTSVLRFFGYSLAGAVVGALLLARPAGPPFVAAALVLAAAQAAALLGVCGLTAATAMDRPLATFLATLSLGQVEALGLFALPLSLVRARPDRVDPSRV